MQNEGQNKNLYRVIKDYIPKQVLATKNKAKTWKYGYNSKYDVIIISQDGTVGEVYEIQNLRVALPKSPKQCIQRNSKKSEQYWERREIPKPLGKMQSIFQWNEMPTEFKSRYVEYIEKEFAMGQY